MSNIHANFVDGVFTISDDNAHSQVLALSEGDFTLSGYLPDGRAADSGETRGAWTGTRKGARAYPTITVTGKLADPSTAFNTLAAGKTASFVSTSAGIGDYPAVDFDFSFDYGAESRSYYGDDAELTDFTVNEGSPYSTVSFSFVVKGPLYAAGATGTVTLISSR